MDDPKQSSAQNAMELDIFLFSNGEKSSPPRKHHLGSEQLVSLEATLSYLARQQYSTTHTSIQLHTLDGQVVQTQEELSDGAAYVAVPLETTFVQSGYNQYLAKASRSREKRLARSTEMDPSATSKDVHINNESIKKPAENTIVVNRLETSIKANNSQRPNMIQPCWRPTGARTAGLKPVANEGRSFPGIGRKLGSCPAELSAHKAVLNKRKPFTPYTRNGAKTQRLSHEYRSLSSEGRNAGPKTEVALPEKNRMQNSELNNNVKIVKKSTNKLKPISKPLNGKLVFNEESKNYNESTSLTNRQVFNTSRASRSTDTNTDGHETEETIKKSSKGGSEENNDFCITNKKAPIPISQFTEILDPYSVLNEVKNLTMSPTKDVETIIPNDKFKGFKAVVTELSSKFVPDMNMNTNKENIVEIIRQTDTNKCKKSQSKITKSSNNISDGQSIIMTDRTGSNQKSNEKHNKTNDSGPHIPPQTEESETSNKAFHRKSMDKQAIGLTSVQNIQIKSTKPNDYIGDDNTKTENENVKEISNLSYIKPKNLDFVNKFKQVEKHSESLDAKQNIDDAERPIAENLTVKFSNQINSPIRTMSTIPKSSHVVDITQHATHAVTNFDEETSGINDPNKDLKKYKNVSKTPKENNMCVHNGPISSLSSRRPSLKIIAEDTLATLLTPFKAATDNITSGIKQTSGEMNKSKAEFDTTYESSKSNHAFHKQNTATNEDIDRKTNSMNTKQSLNSDKSAFNKHTEPTSKVFHHSGNKIIAFVHKGEQVNLQINIAVRKASDTKIVEANEANPNNDMKTNGKKYITHVSIENTSSNLVDSTVYPHICCKASKKMIINKCPCCDWITPDSNISKVLHSLNGDSQPYYVLLPVMPPMFLTEGPSKPESSDKEFRNSELLLKVAISTHELKDEKSLEKEPERELVSTVSENVSEMLIVQSGLTQTSSALLTKEDTEGAYTQTDWSNVLLQAKLHEDGHYTFHLPPLSVLRKYNL